VREAKDGTILGYQGIIRDITERKRLEAQLQQAQKMEAIGTLAGGIAHDFNNLLMGIQGNVSLILSDMDASDPHYQRLKNTEKQIQSGAKLTSHLLGYARKGRYEVKPLSLNQLVEETSETFSRTKREVAIHRELAPDLFAVEADPGQIEQVLWNLFINAADAMPSGGELMLRTANVTHRDMKGKLYDPVPGDYVLLRVTDTGTGIDKEIMGRIFDPFFTTKERGRGTGLGLASAYGIIKGHRGYIDVASRKGKGTTFKVYLPASEKRVYEVFKHSARLVTGTETVLLVDDEEAIRQVGQELLEAMGYHVLLASNGEEAIELYEKHGDEIDLVLLDIVMPHMGGGETYERIKEINPDVRVLLLSGYSIDGEATEILERGCNGFIQKPFTMKELSGKIRDIVEKG
jgi:nitrogen-specific signal transduction histidine kinase/CheY-like chemotaxis protein